MDGRDFARALTILRDAAGLSIRDLARRTMIPSATLGGYFSGRHLPSRPSETLIPILRTCGADEASISDWVSALGRARRSPGPRARNLPQPYPGLKHYEAKEAEWFFGRERVADQLRHRIDSARSSAEPALIVVTGASGSGKSSLLRAGVASSYPDEVITFCPGPDPIQQLIAAVADISDVAPTDPDLDLQAWLRTNTPPLLLIDQLEELFTQCSDETRSSFLAAIDALAASVDGRARTVVVVGLRSDFYRQASTEPTLLAALQENQILLGPMTEADLRRAIIEPARRSGLSIDNDLVELLLRDMASPANQPGAHDAGSLPLMSHALMETWRLHQRGQLTREDYLRTGGITHAAQQTAETLFGGIDEASQRLTRRIFLRLAQVDEAHPMTRRRVARSELWSLTSDAAEVDRILDLFATSRLVTLDASDVQISHESLLIAWPRLAAWLDQDLTNLRRVRVLTSLTEQWESGGRDDDALLRGLRLDDTLQWLAADQGHRTDLNRVELDFIDASVREQARRAASIRRTRRRTRCLIAALAVLILVICMLPGYVIAAHARSDQAMRDARQQAQLAQSRQTAVEAADLEGTDPGLAAQLALASFRIAPTLEARSALLDSAALPTPARILGQSGPTMAAASSDGRLLALTNAVDGSVQLLSRSQTQPRPRRVGLIPGTGQANQLFALAFAPNRPILATGGEDSVARLWDIADPEQPRLLAQLTGITAAVETVAFSSDGKVLAVGGGGHVVMLFDLSTIARPLRLTSLPDRSGAVQAASFYGRLLVFAGEHGLIERWDLADPRHPRQLPALADSTVDTTVESVAFARNGLLLAVGSKDGTVRVWSRPLAAKPRVIKTGLAQLTSWITSLAFAPDSQTLAVGDSGNSLSTWSVPSWQRLQTYAHSGAVTGAVFIPRSSELMTSSADGSGHIWDSRGPTVGGDGNVFRLSYSSDGELVVGSSSSAVAAMAWPSNPSLPPTTVSSPRHFSVDGTATISADGRLIAAGSHSGTLALWSGSRRASLRILNGPTGIVEAISFSPDSRLLAAGGDDNRVHLWDVSDPVAPRALPTLTGHTNFVLYLAFSPDGRTLATASVDKTVRLWDLSDARHPRPLVTIPAFDNYAASVAFSPDGRLLVAGGADHTIRIWNVADRSHPTAVGVPLAGPENTAFTVAVSPDSTILAVGSTDQTVRLWNISEPADPKPMAVLRAAGRAIFTVAFSPDGSSLVAAGSGGEVFRWPVSAEAAAAQICDRGGDAISRIEWKTLIPDRGYRAPCNSH